MFLLHMYMYANANIKCQFLEQNITGFIESHIGTGKFVISQLGNFMISQCKDLVFPGVLSFFTTCFLIVYFFNPLVLYYLQSFWVDNQTRKQQDKEFTSLDGDSVPLYDRGFALGLVLEDGQSKAEG